MPGLVPKKKPQETPRFVAAPSAASAPTATPVVDPSHHSGGSAGWTASQPKATTLVRCARHRDADASVRCDRCKHLWCKWCVKSGREQYVNLTICDCGGRCDPLDVAPVAPATGVEHDLVDALAYPTRGDGIALLAGGAIVFTVITAVSGLFSGVFSLIFAGYQLSWMLRVTRDTAAGKDSPPAFPEFVSVMESMVAPMLKVLLVAALTVGPGVALWCMGGGFVALGVLLTAAGVFVLPMALLAIAIADSFEGFDVLRILRSIPRVGRDYVVAALFFLAVFALLGIGGPWIRRLFLVGPFAASAFALWCLAVAGRLLGRIYVRHGQRLGWY